MAAARHEFDVILVFHTCALLSIWWIVQKSSVTRAWAGRPAAPVATGARAY